MKVSTNAHINEAFDVLSSNLPKLYQSMIAVMTQLEIDEVAVSKLANILPSLDYLTNFEINANSEFSKESWICFCKGLAKNRSLLRVELHIPAFPSECANSLMEILAENPILSQFRVQPSNEAENHCPAIAEFNSIKAQTARVLGKLQLCCIICKVICLTHLWKHHWRKRTPKKY